MSISAERERALRTARNYLFVTLSAMLFGAVYEFFSHGVWSYAMVYACAVPLLLGVLPFLLLGTASREISFPAPAAWLWHTGTAALTLGCVLSGVFAIYGTASPLTVWYFAAGGVFLAGAAVLRALQRRCHWQG